MHEKGVDDLSNEFLECYFSLNNFGIPIKCHDPLRIVFFPRNFSLNFFAFLCLIGDEFTFLIQ